MNLIYILLENARNHQLFYLFGTSRVRKFHHLIYINKKQFPNMVRILKSADYMNQVLLKATWFMV